MKLMFLLLTVGLVSCGSAKEESKKSDASNEEKNIQEDTTQKSSATKGSITLLDVNAFEKQIANAGTILDVRTPAEVAEGIIAEAVVIDFNSEYFAQQIDSLDKTKPVYVYCKAGGRSGHAAEMLSLLGYEVYDLDGGMDAWKAAGKSVAK